MAITPNTNDKTPSAGSYEPALSPESEERVRAAFATLNKVLEEEGSHYGVFGKFTKGELIRTMLIELPANAEESVETVKSWIPKEEKSKVLYSAVASD